MENDESAKTGSGKTQDSGTKRRRFPHRVNAVGGLHPWAVIWRGSFRDAAGRGDTAGAEMAAALFLGRRLGATCGLVLAAIPELKQHPCVRPWLARERAGGRSWRPHEGWVRAALNLVFEAVGIGRAAQDSVICIAVASGSNRRQRGDRGQEEATARTALQSVRGTAGQPEFVSHAASEALLHSALVIALAAASVFTVRHCASSSERCAMATG